MEIDLYYTYTATVTFRDGETATDAGTAALHDEIEIDPEDCSSSLDEYQMIYTDLMNDIRWKIEKRWDRFCEDVESIDVKITPIDEADFKEKMNHR